MSDLKHYDMDGNVVSSEEWMLLIADYTYKVVARTNLPDGKWVSTVLLGIDHNYTRVGPPLIFETMVFPSEGDYAELDVARYATKEEALAGHDDMVKKWSQEVTKEQALAEAWEIGFKAGADFGPNNRPRPDNPYRKDR